MWAAPAWRDSRGSEGRAVRGACHGRRARVVRRRGKEGLGSERLLRELEALLGALDGASDERVVSSAFAAQRAASKRAYVRRWALAVGICPVASSVDGRVVSSARHSPATVGAGRGRRGHRELSGGEAQRVALARAICAGTEVLLLDEPTAWADSASRELIAAALAAVADSGSTLVLATHDDALVDALGARTLRLQGGRIVVREAAS